MLILQDVETLGQLDNESAITRICHMSDHLGCAASQPGRALLFEGLLPSALAVQSYSITLMPPVEAQLWQQQRQQLLSEAVITI